MTLVEVVAGLGLLATLMAALLFVESGVVRQNQAAAHKRAAIVAADQLLAEWWRDPAGFPANSNGTTAGGLAWRTSLVNRSFGGAAVARLEVSNSDGTQAAVEILVPTAGK